MFPLTLSPPCPLAAHQTHCASLSHSQLAEARARVTQLEPLVLQLEEATAGVARLSQQAAAESIVRKDLENERETLQSSLDLMQSELAASSKAGEEKVRETKQEMIAEKKKSVKQQESKSKLAQEMLRDKDQQIAALKADLAAAPSVAAATPLHNGPQMTTPDRKEAVVDAVNVQQQEQQQQQASTSAPVLALAANNVPAASFSAAPPQASQIAAQPQHPASSTPTGAVTEALLSSVANSVMGIPSQAAQTTPRASDLDSANAHAAINQPDVLTTANGLGLSGTYKTQSTPQQLTSEQIENEFLHFGKVQAQRDEELYKWRQQVSALQVKLADMEEESLVR